MDVKPQIRRLLFEQFGLTANLYQIFEHTNCYGDWLFVELAFVIRHEDVPGHEATTYLHRIEDKMYDIHKQARCNYFGRETKPKVEKRLRR